MESPFTNCLPLAAVPNAVPLARVFIRQSLLNWKRRDLIEDAELLASELVTNAIKATRSFATALSRSRIGMIRVCLIVVDALAVIEVWDPNPVLPVLPENVDHFEEGGRGLLLVDRLAKGWGCRRPRCGGKTVWCQLVAPEQLSSSHAVRPLPETACLPRLRNPLEVGMSIEDFHGPHPEPPREEHAKIGWSASVGRSASIRVRAHTCDRESVTYELCAAGGLGHIRRTERTADGDRVSESPWVRESEVRRLWDDLLEGKAR
ncbi:ATP-binding protein [Nonomuraea sp. NPDC050404]|uniref:ATP-binding protein n=1 Tax=Nonomuraea sp. NPDC050404 TaxID=3155783 RepID=UPI0033CA1636